MKELQKRAGIINLPKTKSGTGFTLIELLVVIAILVIIGSIIGSILFSTLRDSSKTTSINEVRSNGNYALSQITKIIQNAKSIDYTDSFGQSITSCVGQPEQQSNTLTVTNLDDTTTTISCDNIGSSSMPQSIIRIIPNLASSLLPTPTPQPLINSDLSIINNSNNPPSPTNCSNNDTYLFTCTQADLYTPPVININFNLSVAGASAVEKQAAINFNTSVTLRNFNH